MNNPARFTDPSGHACFDPQDQHIGCGSSFSGEQLESHRIARKIQLEFKNIVINESNAWNPGDLQELYIGLASIHGNGFNGDTFAAAFGNVTFNHAFLGDLGYSEDGKPIPGRAAWWDKTINIAPNGNWGTVIHEMGHILDGNLQSINHRVALYSETYGNVFTAAEGATDYGKTNPVEDFADSFVAVIKYGPETHRISLSRAAIITLLIQSYIDPVHVISPGR
jgi:hypothetical protein